MDSGASELFGECCEYLSSSSIEVNSEGSVIDGGYGFCIAVVSLY
jgi:hypothetical protein